jgi:hypothetical protein
MNQDLAMKVKNMEAENITHCSNYTISATRIIPKSLSTSLLKLDLHPHMHIQLQKSITLETYAIVCRSFTNNIYPLHSVLS